jgi:hypothetical protein
MIFVRNRSRFWGSILALGLPVLAFAQEPPPDITDSLPTPAQKAAGGGNFPERPLEEMLPGLKNRAVVIDIAARIVERNQGEVWNSVISRVTIPGRPVGLKLVGANLVVAAQFTPYFRRNGRHILVAQGQIWMDIPNEGIQYKTTMQTIPLEFGEQIYFFPLGQDESNEARIEIQLELRPYQTPRDEDSP